MTGDWSRTESRMGPLWVCGRKLRSRVSTKSHALGNVLSGGVFFGKSCGGGVQGPLIRSNDRPGGALYLGGLRQLPAGRPVAVFARLARLRDRARGAALAARRLLGLHRLEGPVRAAALFQPPAQARPADPLGDRLYAAGAAAGAGFPWLDQRRVRWG